MQVNCGVMVKGTMTHGRSNSNHYPILIFLGDLVLITEESITAVILSMRFVPFKKKTFIV